MNAPLASAHLANVEALISAGRFPEADRACDAILSRVPSDPGARYYRAMVRVQAGRFAEALPIIQGLLGENPHLVAARYLLADTYRHSGRFAEAAEHYGRALAQNFQLPLDHDAATRLVDILEFVASAPSERWTGHHAALEAYGVSLEKSGFDLSAPRMQEQLSESAVPLVSNDTFRGRFAGACRTLAVRTDSSSTWMRALAEGPLLDWMRRALDASLFDNALEIENTLYATYVVTTENQEHFRACFALWQDDLRAAGQRQALADPLQSRAPSTTPPRVAFFVHNVTMLAHTTALLAVLQGHQELAAPEMEPWLFYMEGNPEAIEQFRKAGVRTECLSGEDRGGRAATQLVRLRRRIAEEGIDVLAWISLAAFMTFGFGMRLAPRQIWWAMKYHALQFPEIDDYLTGGGETGIHMIQGHPWRVGPVVGAKWFAPELAPEAARVRQALGSRGTIYGSFGRAEKLNSVAFLDVIVDILRQQPDALFLWTGRAHHEGIQQHFEKAGVAERCRFIGWVNTKLYAQVIDVFLDSFPFPGGFTLYEAMAAGKPAVLFESPESDHGGIHAIVGALLRSNTEGNDEAAIAQAIFQPGGEPLYLRASNEGQYVEYALRLARDVAFRERAGRAAQQFIERLMTNRQRAARIYVDHLLGRDPAKVAA